MAYLPGSWETCGALLIQPDLLGFISVTVWVSVPASKAVGNRPFSLRVVLLFCRR